jgi:hypothetical protein
VAAKIVVEVRTTFKYGEPSAADTAEFAANVIGASFPFRSRSLRPPLGIISRLAPPFPHPADVIDLKSAVRPKKAALCYGAAKVPTGAAGPGSYPEPAIPSGEDNTTRDRPLMPHRDDGHISDIWRGVRPGRNAGAARVLLSGTDEPPTRSGPRLSLSPRTSWPGLLFCSNTTTRPIMLPSGPGRRAAPPCSF